MGAGHGCFWFGKGKSNLELDRVGPRGTSMSQMLSPFSVNKILPLPEFRAANIAGVGLEIPLGAKASYWDLFLAVWSSHRMQHALSWTGSRSDSAPNIFSDFQPLEICQLTEQINSFSISGLRTFPQRPSFKAFIMRSSKLHCPLPFLSVEAILEAVFYLLEKTYWSSLSGRELDWDS